MKKTLLLKLDPQKPENKKIQIAANLIKKGGLVAFPTETVYGLGADALNPKAILNLFKAKERPLDNPPIIHVANIKEVYKLAKEVPAKAKKLMKQFWPGPLTLIFKHSELVPNITVTGLETIAIRMPRHKIALALIRESNCPIAAPSANLSGKPSPTMVKHVIDDLMGRIDAILYDGQTCIGVESTVLNMTVDPPQVLRPGGMPFEALKQALGNIELHPVVMAEREILLEKTYSPGIKHRHYAPNADVIVVEGEMLSIVKKIKKLIASFAKKGNKVGVLCTDETLLNYSAYKVRSLGTRKDSSIIAKNLFKLLREFDSEEVDIIIAEGIPLEGFGLAVMNRLRRSSGYKIIKV